MSAIPLTRRRLLALSAALALPWMTRAESFSALRFEQYLESLRLQAGIPGLSAAIVQDRTVAWERGFGQADLERNIPATPDTPYPIGGLTAVFSTVQTLECVERGQLQLNLPADQFAPGTAEAGATLQHLLGHLTPDGRFVHDPERFNTIAAAIKLCTGQTLRLSTFEGLFRQTAMQRSVPGHDFASWSRATLDQFSPDTVARFATVMSELARPHRAHVRGRPTPTTFAPSTGLTGSSGAVATVHDLALFQSALDSGVLLRAETLAQAWTPGVLANGWRSPHGLGWFVQIYEGQLVAWQFGVIPDAYSSLMITLPQRGVTLILLANSDGLVDSFPLSSGDITASPFARLFLRLFA